MNVAASEVNLELGVNLGLIEFNVGVIFYFQNNSEAETCLGDTLLETVGLLIIFRNVS